MKTQYLSRLNIKSNSIYKGFINTVKNGDLTMPILAELTIPDENEVKPMLNAIKDIDNIYGDYDKIDKLMYLVYINPYVYMEITNAIEKLNTIIERKEEDIKTAKPITDYAILASKQITLALILKSGLESYLDAVPNNDFASLIYDIITKTKNKDDRLDRVLEMYIHYYIADTMFLDDPMSVNETVPQIKSIFERLNFK